MMFSVYIVERYIVNNILNQKVLSDLKSISL